MFVTFQTWANDFGTTNPKPVTINVKEVSDVEDWCGNEMPGSMITLKNKKTYIVRGKHEDIVAALKEGAKK